MLKYLGYTVFIPFWYLFKLFPRDENIWVFGSWFGDRFSDNPKVLFEYSLNQKNDNIKCVWLTNNNSVYSEHKNSYTYFFKKWSLKGIWYSLRAKKIIFSSGKVDINPFFINGAITINLWHGAPMKKIGLDNKLVFNKYIDIVKEYIYPFIYEYNINYILSTSNVFDQKLSKAFNVDLKNVLKLGYPRNDIFYSHNYSHPIINKINNDFDMPIKIMYLPTYRDGGDNNDLFKNYGFNPSTLNKYLCNTNSVFITKKHHADNNLNFDERYSRVLNLDELKDVDVNLVLKDVDILLTDYSGAYFDFLLTKKPIIFTSFDFDEYITKRRELYFDYHTIISGPVAKNWSEVINCIDSIILKDVFEDQRIEMNNNFNEYNDGFSSKKLYNFIKSL
jgi:CDP-glycerol glycerophosphotransferase (TagB/SpsB family)